jgi:hypothetical protein
MVRVHTTSKGARMKQQKMREFAVPGFGKKRYSNGKYTNMLIVEEENIRNLHSMGKRGRTHSPQSAVIPKRKERWVL